MAIGGHRRRPGHRQSSPEAAATKPPWHVSLFFVIISTYADLLEWGQKAGALTSSDGQRLARAAAEEPAKAEAVLDRAQELRRLLERILLALVGHRNRNVF